MTTGPAGAVRQTDPSRAPETQPTRDPAVGPMPQGRPEHPAQQVPPTRLLVAVGLAALVVALSQSVIIPVLPLLPAALDATPLAVSWVLTANLLAAAVSVPIAGRLGDMFGKRMLLLIVLGALLAGSAMAALTDQLAVVVAGRALQGMSAAAIPLGIGLLAESMPPGRATSSIGLLSAMLGVGGALGLPLAGLVADHADFHVLFWLLAAAAALVVPMVVWAVPESPVRTRGRLDAIGAVLLAGSLTCLLLALTHTSTWGWTDPAVLALGAAAAALLVLLVFTQSRSRDPLIDLRALRNPPVVMVNIASVLFGFALFASFIGTAGYVTAPPDTGYGLGADLWVGGMALLPSGLAMLAFAPVASTLIHRWGPSRTLALGALVVCAGWAERMVLPHGLWQVVAGSTLVGIGTGIGYSAIPTLINRHSPPTATAAANGLNTLFRSIGNALASSAGGSVLAAGAVTVGEFVGPSLDAYRLLFLMCAAASFLTAALAVFVPDTTSRGDVP